MKIKFTLSARDQFLSGLEYIRQDNPRAARELRKRAEKALARLKRFPKSGRKIPEFPDLPYREVVVPPYRFFYRVREKVVWVVAVWHGAQLPKDPDQP
ncbi:MAG: type II toxin-antitoxin system RelE/ParE family toxin [Caldilineaceae bacterium]